ncbi:MAG: uroporphyrinogen decarboxylase family protein [Candidatus Zipacnadales bacterium]
MNDRERFLACMNYQPVDRTPWWELWYWRETIERWQDEGMPADVHLEQYFGVDRRDGVGVNLGLVPAFRVETLEDTPDYRIYRDGNGVIRQEFKEKGDLTMPRWLRFPLETREDWEKEIKPRLNPDSPCRYPLRWEEMKVLWARRDYPLSISAGSIYGWLRNWMGFERISVTLYDDPEWMQEMMDYIADFVVRVISRALVEVEIDYAAFWEDMAYKTGPHLSPAMFRHFMLAPYKKITSLLLEHGVKVILVDCDGNPEPLIPLWLEAGVNGLYPLERAAGVDPVEWRRKYGRQLRLIGGIDKRAMAAGPVAIDAELAHVRPLVADGGYIPWCDHLVPPDVPFNNYMYYLNRMKEMTLAVAAGKAWP